MYNHIYIYHIPLIESGNSISFPDFRVVRVAFSYSICSFHRSITFCARHARQARLSSAPKAAWNEKGIPDTKWDNKRVNET